MVTRDGSGLDGYAGGGCGEGGRGLVGAGDHPCTGFHVAEHTAGLVLDEMRWHEEPAKAGMGAVCFRENLRPH